MNIKTLLMVWYIVQTAAQNWVTWEDIFEFLPEKKEHTNYPVTSSKSHKLMPAYNPYIGSSITAHQLQFQLNHMDITRQMIDRW